MKNYKNKMVVLSLMLTFLIFAVACKSSNNPSPSSEVTAELSLVNDGEKVETLDDVPVSSVVKLTFTITGSASVSEPDDGWKSVLSLIVSDDPDKTNLCENNITKSGDVVTCTPDDDLMDNTSYGVSFSAMNDSNGNEIKGSELTFITGYKYTAQEAINTSMLAFITTFTGSIQTLVKSGTYNCLESGTITGVTHDTDFNMVFNDCIYSNEIEYVGTAHATIPSTNLIADDMSVFGLCQDVKGTIGKIGESIEDDDCSGNTLTITCSGEDTTCLMSKNCINCIIP